ncbi:putative ribonuclease H-like domain-containing protein [Tanacetum coccineum]
MADVESFPPLHDHMVSSSGGVFVEIPASYANKLIPTSLTTSNLQKLDANVPNDADYDIWLPLTLIYEVNDRMKNSLYGYFISKRLAFPIFASIEGVESVLRNGPWMIRGIPIFLNQWSPSVSLLKKELSHVHVWVKFHDLPLVAYTSDGYGIEINACNEFSDYLAMVVLNLKGGGYAKETISIEYEWKPPRCLDIGADDEGFIKVEQNKSGGNNCGTKNFTVSVKSKTQYRPKEKQSSEGTIPPKTTPFVGTSKASTSGYNKESSSNKVSSRSASVVVLGAMSDRLVNYRIRCLCPVSFFRLIQAFDAEFLVSLFSAVQFLEPRPPGYSTPDS